MVNDEARSKLKDNVLPVVCARLLTVTAEETGGGGGGVGVLAPGVPLTAIIRAWSAEAHPTVYDSLSFWRCVSAMLHPPAAPES